MNFENSLSELEFSIKNMPDENTSNNLISQKFNPDLHPSSTCSICIENFLSEDDISILKCKHIFHYICITQWIEFKSKCPLCRADIKSFVITKLNQETNQRRIILGIRIAGVTHNLMRIQAEIGGLPIFT